MKQLRFLIGLLSFLVFHATLRAQWAWETVDTVGKPTARHEASLVAFENKLFLLGGRRINPVDVYDPVSNRWTARSKTPLELHHFQAVVVDDSIYLMGAMTGRFPRETPLEKVVVYHPKTDTFEFVHSIPESRRRGGAGAVVYDGKIYLVGGITNGHVDGYQPWLDRYDPKTGQWDVLDDAPHARDHFQAVVHDHKLYALAGRTTSQATKQSFALTVQPVDVYDLKTNQWLPTRNELEIPTPRAGNMALAWNHEIVVGGGESATQKPAHDEVEAFDTASQTWRNWPKLNRGRHGSGFAVIGDHVYTASGSGNRGGGPELTTLERLKLPDASAKVASDDTNSIEAALWHTVDLAFAGPMTSELDATNPFTDYRLQVRFEHENGSAKLIRGFYAADGNAANSGADSGSIWKVRFAPDKVGNWTYEASLRSGSDIAISQNVDEGELVPIEDCRGNIRVSEVDSRSADFRTRGFLKATDRHFALTGGGHWIKGGCGSPENFLAFADFDGTYRIKAEARNGEAAPPTDIHRYPSHVKDWSPGDPIWRDDRGKAIIGGVNYLSSMGLNVLYFLTMNIGGDGNDVWPYVSPDELTRFDCSKLDQWEIVFQHMQARGMAMHVVLQETENEKLLDGGETGRLRQLYYQEMIARFAHHPGLIWNLGEENGPADFSPDGQTNDQQKAMASYLKANDPYQHPVVIHTHATAKGKEEVLAGLLGHKPLDGLAFQVSRPEDVHAHLLDWQRRSRDAGRTWMIGMDEIGKWDTGVVPDSVDPNHDGLRKDVLWGALLAGASGVEWYFGARYPHNDLNCEDWRQREQMWRQTTIATQFFSDHLPYWEMTSADQLTSNESDYCYAKPGEVYAIYLPKGESTQLDLEGFSIPFSIQWLDPKRGGNLKSGSIETVSGPGQVSLGQPTHDIDEDDIGQDWVILITSQPSTKTSS